MKKKPFLRFQKWWQVLATIFFVLLLLGIICCVIFYHYCAIYEVTRPEIFMDELMTTMDKDAWLQELVKSAGSYVSEFEDSAALYTDFFNTSLRELPFSYRSRVSESTNTCKVFIVRAGGMNVCQVTFLASEEDHPGFGRHTWILSDITVSDYTPYLSSIQVEVAAPPDKPIFINGHPVTSAYQTGIKIDGPDTQPVELRFSERQRYLCYDIGPMYGNIIVTDSEGREIAALPNVVSGKYLYRYLPTSEELYKISIEAPSDVIVTLNGAVLTAEDISAPGDDIFRHFPVPPTGAEWRTVVYSFSGLYTQPIISATDPQGNSLQPVFNSNGKVYFFYASDEALQSEMENTVRNFLNMYMSYASKRIPWRTLTELIAAKSELRNYIAHSGEAIYWASKTDFSFNMVDISNFRSLGSKAFFCTVRYDADISAENWYETYNYQLSNGYQMIFIKPGSKWLAAEMRAFS